MTARSETTRRPRSRRHAGRRKLPAAVLAAALATGAAGSAGAQSEAYLRGQEAIAAEQWARAVEAFERARRETPSEEAAALYWQAYALTQEGQMRAAERRIEALERRHADSVWIDDARALYVTRGAGELDESGMDEALRLYALSRLMEQDPERALPLVLRLVEGTDSERTRRDAMFLLGVSQAPEAQQAIARIALDSEDPGLRAAAIDALGASGGDGVEQLLRDLVGDDHPAVQFAIVNAAIALDAQELLVGIVRSNENPEVQNAAIHALGAINATEVLRDLYPSITAPSSRMAVLHAMATAGDLAGLQRVIDSERESHLRVTAIRSLGMIGDDGAASMLEALYENPRGPEDRMAVLEAMIMLDEDRARELAVTIAKSVPEPNVAERAVHMLAMIDATDALRDLYEHTEARSTRIAIIQALGIADDATGLARILRMEEVAELRAHAIRSMAHLNQGDESLGETLVALYGDAGGAERQAILDALMMRSDVPTIIQLHELETDRNRKRRLLQILSMLDNADASEYLFQLIERGEQ